MAGGPLWLWQGWLWCWVISYPCTMVRSKRQDCQTDTHAPSPCELMAALWALVCVHADDPGVPWQHTSQLLNFNPVP